MNIAVVDDDLTFQEIFKTVLCENDFDGNVSFYHDPDIFIKEYQRFDAVFLDIEMPAHSGLEIAKKLHDMNKNLIVVFVTSHSELMIQAFGLNVLAFVEKQSLSDTLPSVLNCIEKELAQKKTLIAETKESGITSFEFKKILFCQVTGRKIYLYTEDGVRHQILHTSFQEFYDKFEKTRFITIDRSTFVNVEKIEQISKEYLTVKSYNKPLYFSKARQKELVRAFINYHSV
ncbi:MAG: LytTR family DNA-binding domain-containing protein [Solobacterium sp.]|nr:LytTR family DNA-binding domain-containing protein [Solobacterium sp.]